MVTIPSNPPMDLSSRPRLDLPLRLPPQTQALSSTTFSPPPLDASLTLPELYDWHYCHTPDHPVFVYPGEDDVPRVVKWPEVVRAIHTGARLLRASTKLEPCNGTNVIFAILSAAETFTYFTLIAATIRAGFVPFLISTRNSPEAVAHLLSTTQVAHVLVDRDASIRDTLLGAFDLLQQQRPGIHLPTYSDVPHFDDLFISSTSTSASSPSSPFELLPDYKPDLSSLGVILHSSGSTAFPKAIGWSHLQLIQLGFVPYFGERDLTGVRLSCHAMPMSHGTGMMQTVWAATMGIVITAATPRSPPVPPTPDNVLASARATATDVIFCVPFYIETWAHQSASVEYLSQIHGVLFCGAPLNKEIGDNLTRDGVTIFNLYGCAEVGIISPILPQTTGLDWEYFSVSKQLKGKFLPNGHGQYRLVVTPSPYEIPPLSNGTLDGKDATYSGDLFVAHPTRSGYYKLYGRVDDQILHSTGEQTNPGPLENILKQDPRIRAAVIFGHGRFNIGVIIDPEPAYRFDPSIPEKLAEFRNAIWPTIEQLNKLAPRHSRLFKEMILVSLPHKAFDYTAKNTARRQTIIAHYEAEIDALYTSTEDTILADTKVPNAWTMAESLTYVREVVQKVLGLYTLSDDENIFLSGCDSIKATLIRNTLLRAIRDSTGVLTGDVAGSVICERPSIQQLATYVVKLASKGIVTPRSFEEKQLIIQHMAELVDRHTMNFPNRSPRKCVPQGDGEVYLVTGTTGSLGANILSDLLKSSHVHKVFALNRPSINGALPANMRQESVFRSLGLPLDLLECNDRLVFIDADTSNTGAGLTSALLEEIRSSVTHIIMAAWASKTDMPLQSFEPSIEGIRNVIDIALASYRTVTPTVVFMSSIGVLHCRRDRAPAPELPATADDAVGTGHTQAKWVAEAICLKAASKTSLQPKIIRIGHLCGNVGGRWRETDWLPRIVRLSMSIGCFPSISEDTTINWMSVDEASRITLDLVRSNSSPIFHLTYSQPTPASLLSDTIASTLRLDLLPYAEWANRLTDRTNVLTGKLSNEIPGSRMPSCICASNNSWFNNPVDNFLASRASALLETKNSELVDRQTILLWIKTWTDLGYLSSSPNRDAQYIGWAHAYAKVSPVIDSPPPTSI